MSVVMISLTLSRALSMPGMKPQNAPPMKPAIPIATSITQVGESLGNTYRATPVAMKAPMKNCPSAPTLKRRMRSASATPKPITISGTALMVVSDQP